MRSLRRPSATRVGECGLVGLFLAAALVAVHPRWRAVGAPAPEAAKREADRQQRLAAARSGIDDPEVERFSRFAANVLLVPLLDDSEPPRWHDVELALACGPQGVPRLDGAPLPFGTPVPSTPFRLEWTLDRCAAFADPSAEISGRLEVRVSPSPVGYTLWVVPHGVTIATPHGPVAVEAPFMAPLRLR